MNLSGNAHASLGLTHLTEGVECQVLLAQLRPAMVISFIDPLGTLVSIVISVDLFGVLLAVGLVGKLWAARKATRFLW